MAVRSSSSSPSLIDKDGQARKISARDIVIGDYTTSGNRYGSLNQDNFISMRVAKNVWVFGIFDGHGELGELASQCAAECLRTYFYVHQVIRAAEILGHLEKEKVQEINEERMKEVPKANYQLNLFDPIDPNYNKVKDMMAKLDINTISPVEALLKLNELKGLLSS